MVKRPGKQVFEISLGDGNLLALPKKKFLLQLLIISAIPLLNQRT